MYLDANTVATLPEDVNFRDNCLYDSVVDNNHKLNETGAIIVSELLNGANIGQACAALAEKCKKQPREISNDVYTLIELLNQKALIHLENSRRFTSRLKNYSRSPMTAYLDILELLEFKADYKIQRYSADLLGIISSLKVFLAVVLVSGALASIMILVTMLATKAFILKSEVYIASTVPLFTSMLFAISMIAHEYGHLWALRKSGMGQQCFVIGRVFAVSIAHPKLPRELAILVSVFGPLFVLMIAIAATFFIWFLNAPNFYYFFVMVLCAVHLYTLTPWNKDGQILWGLSQK